MVTVAVLDKPLLSVAVNWNVYTPAINPVTVVDKLDAAVITAVFGPLICVQVVDTIVAPLLPVAVPVNVVVLIGNVTVCADPAFTLGGTLGKFTVIVTVAVFDKPSLSVADNWNVYTPATNPLTAVDKLEADAIAAVFGPLVCVHIVEIIVAPLLPVAVPVNVTVLTGNVIVCAVPALTVGGIVAGLTVIVTVAAFDKPLLSVADNWNVYTPAIKPLTVVDNADADPIVAVFGPLISDHTVDTIVAPLLPVAVPVNVTELTGSVMICAKPALTLGGIFARFTVIVTVAVPDKPSLSVADNWNVYTPAINPVTVVDKFDADAIAAVFGPLVCVHEVDIIVAPPFPVAVPVNVTVLTGNVIVCAVPALTVGGIVAGLTVIVTVAVFDNPLLSVADNWNVYTPAINPVTLVLRFEVDPIAAVFGPLTCDQLVEIIIAPLLPDALPVKVTALTGNVIVCVAPAFTLGGTLAGFTVIVIVEVLDNPSLSVADNWNVYTPAIKPLTVVDNADADVIVAVFGPLVCVHEVDTIVAPLLPVAVPVNVTVLTGNVIVCAVPAFTVGGIVAAFTVTVTVAEFDSPLLSVADNWNV